MATIVEELNTTLANLVHQRMELSRSPKPSYQAHGQNFSWNDYHRYLGEEIDKVLEQLAKLDPLEEIGVGI